MFFACMYLLGDEEIGAFWPFCEGVPSGGVSYLCTYVRQGVPEDFDKEIKELSFGFDMSLGEGRSWFNYV